jgi:nitrite reductase/ring-hydroxylating ferredoxin subunit
MKPTGIAGDPMAHPTMWSAPPDEIPPGRSAKFHILWGERLVEGFVVNFGGRYYAYVNYCIHAGTPLDWWPNEFFNGDRRFLTCGTHGSLYEPDTGKCAGGPCGNGSLFPLRVQVTGGRIVVTASCDPQDDLCVPKT